MSDFTASNYMVTDDEAWIMVRLDWFRVQCILGKGSLEDDEEETIFAAIKQAVEYAEDQGIDTDPEYEE